MKNIRNLGVNTQCVHAGIKEDAPYGAVNQAIYQTSTFKFKDADQGARLFQGEENGYIYTRIRNPTVEAMEDAVAILEGGAKAVGCASGMAAVHTLFASVLKAGDHLICTASSYGSTITLLQNVMPLFNIETSFVDTHKIDEIKKVIKPNTKLIYVESPCNPTMMISDIAEIAKLVQPLGIKLAVDNTYCSPILQSPFQFGADYIVHSMTKYINGHADVVAGVIVVKTDDEYLHFRKMMNHYGGIIDPFNAFLVHRGIKTLKLRVEAQQKSAQLIAEFLDKHPKVDWVLYPGLKSHPQYELGQKQMKGSGSMIAFGVKGGIEGGKTLMNSTEIIQLAVSLGGIESLIQHPATMTHALMGQEAREAAGISDGMLRLSVGIEDVNDLISELDAGLNSIK